MTPDQQQQPTGNSSIRPSVNLPLGSLLQLGPPSPMGTAAAGPTVLQGSIEATPAAVPILENSIRLPNRLRTPTTTSTTPCRRSYRRLPLRGPPVQEISVAPPHCGTEPRLVLTAAATKNRPRLLLTPAATTNNRPVPVLVRQGQRHLTRGVELVPILPRIIITGTTTTWDTTTTARTKSHEAGAILNAAPLGAPRWSVGTPGIATFIPKPPLVHVTPPAAALATASSSSSSSTCVSYTKIIANITTHPTALLIPGPLEASQQQAALLPPQKSKKKHTFGANDDTDDDRTTAVVVVSDLDVLLGRGGYTNHHIGNVTMRYLVASYRSVYTALPRGKKALLARNLVHFVQWQGGRFLAAVDDDDDDDTAGKTNTKEWYECGNARARQKVLQTLREGTRRSSAEMDIEESEEDDDEGG
jgi:hypothetical protein